MSKSLVERYEQMLGQDPTSTIFVELARALLEKGEHARAIEVCQAGLTHHEGSVVGRVLWGKALINLGRPAEAMEQFDAAIGIDKENPHAYNLIGEVLLQKGLYRSALPLLRRAAALQPNDARIRGWLEQTQQALQGGPAPVVPDASAPDSLLNAATREEAAPEPPAPSEPAPAPITGEEAQGWFGQPARAPLLDLPPPPEEEEAEGGPGVVEEKTPTEEAPAPSRPPPMQPPGARAAPPPAPPPPRPSGAKKVLLEDIPDLATPEKVELPRVELAGNVTRKIAEEYERELKARLEQTAKQKTLVQKHGAKIALVAVGLVAVAVGTGGFLYTRSRHQGKDLKDALAAARKAIAEDTPGSYRAALDSLAIAHEMDEESTEAWALEAYARALRVEEHGGGAKERAKAEAALARAGVPQEHPGLALAARYYLAGGSQRAAARKEVLASTLDQPEVHELAGRLLMEQKQAKRAVDRFKQALELSAKSVRALAALGNYYREFGDCPNAVKFYETAEQVSPRHPESAAGAAECRLELQQDVATSLQQVESLPAGEELPGPLAARLSLVRGRLLSAVGRHDAALEALAAGLKEHPGHAHDFQVALGEASRAKGNLAAAQRALEAALEIQDREETKEALGRVLLMRDQEKELLRRLGAEGSRKMALLRGMAQGRLGDWKRARAELGRTRQNGKYPPEAVVQLALADAAEGQEARAQEVLEKVLASTRTARSDVHVALGQVYWKQGALERARAQLEEAMKDPLDYEGGCVLGRMLIAQGQPERALEPLGKAASRNPAHGEAQHALSRVLLQTGKLEEGVAWMDAWARERPDSAQAQEEAAEVLLRAGKVEEAEAAVARAVRLAPASASAALVQAQILYARGDGPGAFAALQRANKLDSRNAETFCEIGRTFLRQGNPTNAGAAFAAAVKNDPQSACGAVGTVLAGLPGSASRASAKQLEGWAGSAAHAHDRALALATLARVHLLLRAIRTARSEAEKAVALGPSVAQAHLALGLVAEKQNEMDLARESLERATALDPTNGSLYLALGDLLARSKGDAAKVVAAYETFLRMGGTPEDTARVEKALAGLRKRAAASP